ESLDHARKRDAYIYAEVAGYAATSEAHHMVVPREDGLEVAHTMSMALRNARVRPAQVDYINAHATSTPIGDVVEIKAIRQLFRRRANQVAINATKSLLGHTLGAAGIRSAGGADLRPRYRIESAPPPPSMGTSEGLRHAPHLRREKLARGDSIEHAPC